MNFKHTVLVVSPYGFLIHRTGYAKRSEEISPGGFSPMLCGASYPDAIP